MTVYFKAENNSFWAASKLVRGAVPEPARMAAVAHDVIGAQASIQCHTGGTPGNVYFSGCHICVTPVVSGLTFQKI